MAKKYDPVSKKWINVSDSKPSSKGNTSGSNKDNTSSDNDSKGTSSKSSGSSSEDNTKEYEYHILTGKLSLILTKDTLKLRAGDTVYCKGFGKYLSGKYYINDISRTVSTSGFSTSVTLIRMNFGESLKTGGTVSDSHANRNYSPDTIYNSPTVKKATNNKTKVVNKYHTVQKGETLWVLALRFYKDGSKFIKIAKANNLPIIIKNGKKLCKIKVGQKLLIP